jgi:hypothetical protein
LTGCFQVFVDYHVVLPFVRLLASKLSGTPSSPEMVASRVLQQKLKLVRLRSARKKLKSAAKIIRSKGKRKPQKTMKSKMRLNRLKKRRSRMRKMWTETLARRLAGRELTHKRAAVGNNLRWLAF